MADKYVLSVTAGPNYKEQKQVAVNSEQPLRIESPHLTANLLVRIKDFRGLPSGSPSTSPYFEHAKHKSDRYSLDVTFTPKADLNGHDLVLGNDFDHPIRDKLPPGFHQAFKIATWFIDPGLYGDVNADEPYLYGPLLSSINTLRLGPKDDREQERVEEARANKEVHIIEEGADGDDAEQVRRALGLPSEGPARQKFFLTESHLLNFTYEKGREYSHDFFNPYLDFNDFALRLPGFGVIPGITLPIISYWDGQPLRYVLKNRATNEPLLVVVFQLIPKDQQDKGKEAETKTETEKQDAAPKGGDDELD